jgi:nitrogen regulatory protein P-II 1
MLNPCLIVSIVRKGWGDTVLRATIEAGAQGGEPEKEIVLTIVLSEQKGRIERSRRI